MNRLRQTFLIAVCALALSTPVGAADLIRPVSPVVVAQQGDNSGLFFSASFDIELTEEIADVLRRGIPLHFVLEVRVEKKRWYWTDKEVGEATERFRLSYNPMTRQYRVSFGGINQNFDTREQALAAMSHIAGLKLGSWRDLNDGYEAQARFYLDKRRLPKPFQVMFSRDKGWDLSTGWFSVPLSNKRFGD